ncbi:MAG: ketoacyl-ACP synthase III [Bacteroidales bacterium]
MKISKIDYYLPEKELSNTDLKVEFPEWDYEKFEQKVGVQSRRIANELETALDLGFLAAQKIITDDDRQTIDYLLFCTQSPDYFLPSGSCILQDRLKLNKEIGALDFNLGCSGFVYGLSIAKGLIKGQIAKKVLLITAETYSKQIHPKDLVNRAIFGDGAAACIIEVSDEEKIGIFMLGTDGSGADKLITKNGAFRFPSENNPEIKTNGLNYYTDNNLYMNGPDIFNFTIEMVPVLINQTLAKNCLNIEDVDYFIYHQANAYMLNFLRKLSNIPKERFYVDLSNTGNTVSSTIPIAIVESIKNKKIREGHKVLIAGFGVGFSWGATIITI